MGTLLAVKEFSLGGVVVPSPGLVASDPSCPAARVLGPLAFFCFSFVFGGGVWDFDVGVVVGLP